MAEKTIAGIRFDPVVTWGHVLQTVAIISPMIVWGATVENRLDQLEGRSVEQVRVMEKFVDRVESRLIRMEDKLDKKLDK
jgi:hypothetical protein